MDEASVGKADSSEINMFTDFTMESFHLGLVNENGEKSG